MRSNETVICVHPSDTYDDNERRTIKKRIEEILVIPWDVLFITQEEAHLSDDEDFEAGFS